MIRREDEIPPEELRPRASVRPPEPPAESPVEPTPRKDLGDGRIPGTAAHAILQAEADQLAKVAPGTFLYGILEGYFNSALDKFSYVAFMQNLVKQMEPANPLEAMLVEQIALSHHALGRAHVRAANANNPEAAKVFYAAAGKLQAEFRHSLLALKTYRATSRPSPRPLADQVQNAPVSGLTKPEAEAVPQRTEMFGDSELGSKNRLSGVFDELVELYG